MTSWRTSRISLSTIPISTTGRQARISTAPVSSRCFRILRQVIVDCVIVKDLSRLGRNSIDTGYYIEQYFYSHNVRFIAVTDQFDTADPGNLHGGIMLPLKNMINEAYALDIGRKIKAQARQAMKDGDYIGGQGALRLPERPG